MENQISNDIKRIYKRISELERALIDVHPEDHRTLRELRADIVRFESELTRKQALAHQIEQDKNLKNREIEARIEKIVGVGKEVEDMSSIYAEIYNNVEIEEEDDGEEED